jgi:hypothetical protein
VAGRWVSHYSAGRLLGFFSRFFFALSVRSEVRFMPMEINTVRDLVCMLLNFPMDASVDISGFWNEKNGEFSENIESIGLAILEWGPVVSLWVHNNTLKTVSGDSISEAP